MVQRIESSGRAEEIEGIVESVELKNGTFGPQYEVTIKSTNVEVKGKTGRFHEWIPMSKSAKEDAVPQGSAMERYLTQVEICIPAAKKAATVKQALGMLVGKKVKFGRIKLGKDFEGNPAREYLVPIQMLN